MSVALSQRVEEGQGIEPCTVAIFRLHSLAAAVVFILRYPFGATLLVVLGLRSTEICTTFLKLNNMNYTCSHVLSTPPSRVKLVAGVRFELTILLELIAAILRMLDRLSCPTIVGGLRRTSREYSN